MYKLVVLLILVVFPQISFAKEARLNRAAIKKMVSEFYLSKFYEPVTSAGDNCEPPNKGRCIQVACSKMSSYYCDSRSDVEEVAMACSNVDGDCIENVCNKMAGYSCDDLSDIKAVATVCKGLLDSDCINVVCSKLSSFECDDLSDLKVIVEMCKNP